MNKAQKYLLKNNLADIVINTHNEGPMKYYYVSDVMMEFITGEKIFKRIFELEMIRSFSSDRHCEYTQVSEERREMTYRLWLEDQLEKFVDMKKREGYRF